MCTVIVSLKGIISVGTLVPQHATHSLASRKLEHLKEYCSHAEAEVRSIGFLAGLTEGACPRQSVTACCAVALAKAGAKRSQNPNEPLPCCSKRNGDSILKNARTGREKTDTGTMSSIMRHFAFSGIGYFAPLREPEVLSICLKRTYARAAQNLTGPSAPRILRSAKCCEWSLMDDRRASSVTGVTLTAWEYAPEDPLSAGGPGDGTFQNGQLLFLTCCA